jgi:hypothetical protein
MLQVGRGLHIIKPSARWLGFAGAYTRLSPRPAIPVGFETDWNPKPTGKTDWNVCDVLCLILVFTLYFTIDFTICIYFSLLVCFESVKYVQQGSQGKNTPWW